MIFFFFFVREFGLFQQVCPRLLTMFPSKFLQPHCVSFFECFCPHQRVLADNHHFPAQRPWYVCVCMCVCVCVSAVKEGRTKHRGLSVHFFFIVSFGLDCASCRHSISSSAQAFGLSASAGHNFGCASICTLFFTPPLLPSTPKLTPCGSWKSTFLETVSVCFFFYSLFFFLASHAQTKHTHTQNTHTHAHKQNTHSLPRTPTHSPRTNKYTNTHTHSTLFLSHWID